MLYVDIDMGVKEEVKGGVNSLRSLELKRTIAFIPGLTRICIVQHEVLNSFVYFPFYFHFYSLFSY